ncbi:MAG: type 1 glutamine amidotransferase [Solirubrobacterales bacterium]
MAERSDKPGAVLQNEAVAPAALLEDWLRERGLPHRTVPVWEAEVPDDPREFAWVAALGAEDSVTQSEPAWVPAEIEFLRRAVEADVPVLGLCFGGQALSAALGGEISPAVPPSIGWFEIETDDPEVVPEGPWAHFNLETFSVPARAAQLARSPRGPGAFRLGPHLGLQFHPEATPAVVNRWSDGEAEKLAALGLDPAEIRAQGERWGAQAARRAFELFDAWRRLAPA